MATTYTGSAAGGSFATAAQISIPQDAVETLGVASVNVPLQKIADYIANLSQMGTTLAFGGIAGNVASTNYVAWIAGYSLAAMGTTVGAFGAFVLMPLAGRILGMSAMGTNGMAGGSCIVQTTVAGADSGPSITLTAAQAGNATFTGAVSFAASTGIGVRCRNQAGVTTGLGQIVITLFLGPP